MLLLSVLLLMSQAKGVHLECGVRPIFEGGPQHSRIIEGMEAEVGEFPWLVSIQARNEHFCGGTIINEWWIVTAAHCLFNDELVATDLNVVLGTNDLQSPSLEIKGVTRIVIHKDFKNLNMDNDIALLLLNSPITFSGLKEPICMPRKPRLSTWRECWVAGWGQTKTGDKRSMKTDLMKVPMVIMDWEECSKLFSKLTKNMLCAGYKNESYDACQCLVQCLACDKCSADVHQIDELPKEAGTYLSANEPSWRGHLRAVLKKGDSGGPLVCTTESSKKWYQVGIISWGRSCGKKNTPGIYTLLENYSPWIKKVTEIEGRPYDTEKVRTPLQNQLMKSQAASEFPESGSPKFWLLLCLLSYVLF